MSAAGTLTGGPACGACGSSSWRTSSIDGPWCCSRCGGRAPGLAECEVALEERFSKRSPRPLPKPTCELIGIIR